jgi:membrane protein
LWVGASMLFSWYVQSFDSYNRIYGSLGAAIGFMTWTWLSILIVLVGATLNAEMEHQTAQDTTEGRPKPLGQRGANMADHVGPSVQE